jgi:Rrf2 family protein
MRLELSNRTEFARRALEVLSTNPKTARKGTELAAEVGTTRYYLPQVMRPLVAAGWVTSEPGPTGGYRITHTPGSATLWDLISIVERPADEGRCVVTGGRCSEDNSCSVHHAWQKARSALQRELATAPAVSRSRAVP